MQTLIFLIGESLTANPAPNSEYRQRLDEAFDYLIEVAASELEANSRFICMDDRFKHLSSLDF